MSQFPGSLEDLKNIVEEYVPGCLLHVCQCVNLLHLLMSNLLHFPLPEFLISHGVIQSTLGKIFKTGKFFCIAFQLSGTFLPQLNTFLFSEVPKVTPLFLFYPLFSIQTFILRDQIKNKTQLNHSQNVIHDLCLNCI